MNFLISVEQKAVIIPAFPNTIPDAKPLDLKGKRLWVVPFDLDNVIKLRALGYAVPSPIGSYYKWPRELSKIPVPFQNQLETAAFFSLYKRAYCENEIGTGKTMRALWSADYLMSIGKIRKVLIDSPFSTLDRVWHDAIWNHMGHRAIGILHGTAAKRRKLFSNNAFDFFAVNHEGLEILTEKTYKEVKGQRVLASAKLMRDDIDLLIIDELAAYRNSKTAKWAILNRIIQANPKLMVWGMTGTPTPNAPTDAWAQVRLITPERVTPYFSTFRGMVMQQMTEYIWVPLKESANIVHQVMRPSIRFVRDECFDLPPCMYSERHVELSAEQKKHYKEIKEEAFTVIKGGKISAANEGVLIGKLLQIACGVVYDKEGIERAVDASPRVSEILDIIDEAGQKVIIFVPYTAPLLALAKYVEKHLAPRNQRCAVVYGGVSKSQRGTIFTEFQKRPDLRVLLADAGCMSHGLTLTEANTIVWFAPEHSNDTYTQGNGRITRPGQKNNQFIIHVEGSEIERRIYKRLKERGHSQGLLLQLIKEGAL